MNQIIDIGFKKAKLQDIIETYQDYICKISKDYDFPDWWYEEKDDMRNWDDCHSDVMDDVNSLWIDPNINYNYIYLLPVRYRLSYIERKVMKAIDDKLDGIFDFYRRFERIINDVRSFVKSNFNRDEIVNRLKQLEDYPEEDEFELENEEEDLYEKYY